MIGISIAASKEWKVIIDRYNKGDKDLISYPYGEYFIDNNLIFYRCGTRKTKAAGATQYMISHFNMDKIIAIGTAAGMSNKYNLLDVFVPNKVVQVDCTYVEDGEEFKDDYIVDIDLSKYNSIEFNSCTIGSSDKPMIYKDICELMEKNDIVLVDMESAPIAYICKVNDIQCIIIKGISDIPGNYDSKDENQFEEYVINIPKVMNKICDEYLNKYI